MVSHHYNYYRLTYKRREKSYEVLCRGCKRRMRKHLRVAEECFKCEQRRQQVEFCSKCHKDKKRECRCRQGRNHSTRRKYTTQELNTFLSAYNRRIENCSNCEGEVIDYDLVTGDTICSSCGFVLKTDNIQDVVEEGDGTLYRFSKSRPYQTTVYVREKLRSVHGSDPLIWYDHWKLIKGHILRVFGSDYGDALQNMGPKTFSRICREITVAREEDKGEGAPTGGSDSIYFTPAGGKGGSGPCTLERGRERIPEVESSVHGSLGFRLLDYRQGEEVDSEHQGQVLQEGPDEREREWYSLELLKESATEESDQEETYIEYTLPGPQDHLCLDVPQLHGQDRGPERPLAEQGYQPLARCKYGERWVQARRRLGLSTPEPMELSIVVDICRKTRVFELVHKEKFQFKLTNKNCLNLNYFILQIIRMNSEAAFHYWKRYIPLSSGKLEEYNPVWKEMILVLGKDYDRYFEEEENCFYELKWSYIPMYFCDLWLPKKERYH